MKHVRLSKNDEQCICSQGTRREYSSKLLKHSIAERILVI